MFFQLGEKRHGDSAEFNGIHQEMLDNKIDAFSKAFQAMTVGCARCHDHKLDAVSQRDYYALAGAFMSPRWVANTLDTPDRNAQYDRPAAGDQARPAPRDRGLVEGRLRRGRLRLAPARGERVGVRGLLGRAGTCLPAGRNPLTPAPLPPRPGETGLTPGRGSRLPAGPGRRPRPPDLPLEHPLRPWQVMAEPPATARTSPRPGKPWRPSTP